MTSSPYPAIVGSLLIVACQSPIPSTQAYDLEATPVVAPISKSLKISEAFFSDPQSPHIPQPNVFDTELKGSLKVLIEDYQDQNQLGFEFKVSWSILDQHGKRILQDQFKPQGGKQSNQVWVDIPLHGSANAGTYVLVIQFLEQKRNERLGYQQELILSRDIDEADKKVINVASEQ